MEFRGKDVSAPAGLAAWLVLLGGCAAEEPRSWPDAPVLLVVMDALDSGHLHHLGYERETSPTLDALAEEGFSFRRALSPAPYTLAGIPSLLTGRYPDTHGLVRKAHRLPEAEETLAELLRDAGYATFGSVANYNGSAFFGCDQGFDVFLEPFRLTADATSEEFEIPDSADLPGVLAEWIEATPADRPGFYYVHMLEPHSPYDPPEPWRSTWIDPEYRGPMERGATEVLVESEGGRRELSAEDRQAALDLYDANVLYADEILRRLLDVLRERDLYDETLVVVTSDHGEAFWQHGHWGHNELLHDEMLRVPLVVKPPAGEGARGLVVEGLASTLDLVPTVVDWVGAARPKAVLEGRPLDALIDGAREGDRDVYLRTNADRPSVGVTTPAAKTIMMRDSAGARIGVEHYDLEEDPAELAPLPGDGPRERAQLEGLIEWARRKYEENQGRRAERAEELSPAARELLKSLGYTDDQ